MPGMTKQDSPLHITQGLSAAADDEDVVLNDIGIRVARRQSTIISKCCMGNAHAFTFQRWICDESSEQGT